MGIRHTITTKQRWCALEDRRLHLYDTILILLDQIHLIEHEMTQCKNKLDQDLQ
jgi:hypothetical protein